MISTAVSTNRIITKSLLLSSSSLFSNNNAIHNNNLRRRCRVQQQKLQCYNQRRHHQVKVTQSSSIIYNNNDDDATELVDNLIDYTRLLMKSEGRHHVIAFSGGVDSSLVLALLQQAASKSNELQPVLGISPAVSLEQIDLARKVCTTLQIPLTEVCTTEGSDGVYIANAGEACFACKTHLYTSLQLVLNHASSEKQHSGSLYNGMNADDIEDSTRLGLIAAANFRVLSPLQHTPKADVRKAAKHLGLPNWNYAASPCLRSRLAIGVEATHKHLDMIERAERIVRETLSVYNNSFNESTNMRVRLLSKQRARIEIDPDFVDILQQQLNNKLQISFQKLGFTNGVVDVKVFQSGSVAGGKISKKKTSTSTTTSVESALTTTQLSSSLAA